MLYVGVFILVAIASYVVVSDIQGTEVPLQQNTVAKETGEGFASVMTLAVKGGEGFAYNYTFPRTIFGRPYSIGLRNVNEPNATIIIEWAGDYGDFAYQYNVPSYEYKLGGPCLSGQALNSSACSNVLMLNNDGENLTITQKP